MLTRRYTGVTTRRHYCNMVEPATARIPQDGTCADCFILVEVFPFIFKVAHEVAWSLVLHLLFQLQEYLGQALWSCHTPKQVYYLLINTSSVMCSNAHATALSFQRGRGWVYLHGTDLQQHCHCPPTAAPSRERTQTSLSRWKRSKTTLRVVLPLPGGCGSGYRTEETGSVHKPWERWKRSTGHAPNKSVDCNQEQRLSQAVALALG